MKTITKATVILFLLGITTVQAQATEIFFTKANTFFNSYVSNGKVAYQEIKKQPKHLNELVALLKTTNVTADNVKNYQAFWINAYNISVIKNVVENYPLKTPLDKAGFFDKIKHNVAGKELTLNDMEHKMLRAVFPKEARFHFVLVCAGLGCPPIINKAYIPSMLEDQLQKQTEIAINNPNFIMVNKNKVKLSQIFEWYKGDFTQGGKSLIDFVNLYRKEKINAKAKVSFYPYDWTLNRQ
ncbi:MULTISPECIES: DUF547 domain-containing protein [Cellulophaga]|uniref:DUF547 domain-containing protein n=1 Tax=Cellulophaga geojensis KL-A TaxID=1328323 RepID=A0ABN0RK21_9FLAO|nr:MULTISPECIES: DUF547 domain-containing protein [Cellulophaga]EWH11098.1 hypothetical protein KLA_15980 [Cellulophaga geojensis KL-A]MDO6853949.1 DUF547 domain-containing protein [Cellulophaga lytica]SNQ43437.1 Conserved hypothetical periplasmic protein [Cellulophaga lytica]